MSLLLYKRVLFSGRGTARAEDAQGTPTQSHISPSILVYEDESVLISTPWFAENQRQDAGVEGDSAGHARVFGGQGHHPQPGD